jgi:hypothetical protein
VGKPGLTLAAFLAVGAIATAASGSDGSAGRVGPAHLKIPLPAENSVKVTRVTVKVTAPAGHKVGALKVVATNASQLGGPQLNTQVVAAVKPKRSRKSTATFKVFVFVHRYQPVPGASDRAGAASGPTVNLSFGEPDDIAQIQLVVATTSCAKLDDFGYLTDGWESLFDPLNLVPSNDTDVEEQLDVAVFDGGEGCPGAEDPESESNPSE